MTAHCFGPCVEIISIRIVGLVSIPVFLITFLIPLASETVMLVFWLYGLPTNRARLIGRKFPPNSLTPFLPCLNFLHLPLFLLSLFTSVVCSFFGPTSAFSWVTLLSCSNCSSKSRLSDSPSRCCSVRLLPPQVFAPTYFQHPPYHMHSPLKELSRIARSLTFPKRDPPDYRKYP